MKNITSIALIIVSISIFFFFIDPQYKEVKKLRAEIVTNQDIINRANKLDSKEEELTQKYNQISPEEKKSLEKLLPDTVDNVRLIIDINNIAEKFGIVIRDVNVTTRDSASSETKKVVNQKSNFDGVLEDNSIKYVDTSKIGIISFSFTVSAKYEVFLEFLRSLEASLRLVDIRNMEISRGGEGVFYDYRVTFDTYWLK
jgi:hypothetical protein